MKIPKTDNNINNTKHIQFKSADISNSVRKILGNDEKFIREIQVASGDTNVSINIYRF